MKILRINKNRFFKAIGLIIFACAVSCQKQDEFLDKKSRKNDVTPESLTELQAVLDNSTVMNSAGSVIGLAGTDNLYLPDVNLSASDVVSRNAYLWNSDIWSGTPSADWFGCYQAIAYANIVLKGLVKIKPASGEQISYDQIYGSGLFFRAFNIYQLSQVFCKPFVTATATTDQGIPYRTSSDVNIRFERGNVSQTYEKMIADLKTAIPLLPEIPLYRTRPSKAAAHGLLAKIYLSKADYVAAFAEVKLALQKNSTLLDYRTLPVNTLNPFPTFARGNPEVLFYAKTYGLPIVWASTSTSGRAAPALIQQYEDGDLRKSILFTADPGTGLFRFKASYSGDTYNFCGIAVNELLLVAAECAARTGDLPGAISYLNQLLQGRYTTAAYRPVTATTANELIDRLLSERRKELPFTGNIRWEDLRRVNQETTRALTLSRMATGSVYTLQPNDRRYTYPLPDDELQLGGVEQNPR